MEFVLEFVLEEFVLADHMILVKTMGRQGSWSDGSWPGDMVLKKEMGDKTIGLVGWWQLIMWHGFETIQLD